ncbi:esterase [Streptomyces fumigatiscleroticus]|nr:esterase [Streptomyces fumigatiscleroticus]
MKSTDPSTSAPDPDALPPVPVDPELAAAVHHLGRQPPVTRETVAAVRATTDAAGATDETLRGDGTFHVEERAVPGPGGAPRTTLLVCRPAGADSPRPVLYHLHGGGMIAGSRRHIVSDVLTWTRELGAVLVSAEYRLAPEHPHPAPLQDCYAGLLWTARHADGLGADPDRIVVVGTSAGGGLAAATALLARDRGGPALAGQMLLSPMLDDRDGTPSGRQMAGVDLWDRVSNATGWQALLGDRAGGPDVSPYAAPARAGDLSGLPPAYLDVGSAETFRDETVAYASRLWQCGARCELHVWAGGYHGFDELAPRAAVSRRAKAARRQWLYALLGAASAPA